MRINSDLLIKIDVYSDYVPCASTLTNLVDLFQKCVVLPLMSKETIKKSHYFSHLQDKCFFRSIILIIPILGNLFIHFTDRLVQAIKNTYDPDPLMLIRRRQINAR